MKDYLAHAIEIPLLLETLAFLLTVVIVVPLCRAVRISPIIGFLAVGGLIGPYALGLVDDVATVQHVAELGVIFLLFAIGLELSFERLAAFAKHIFGLGGLHCLFCASVIGGVALYWGNSVEAAIIIGLCLALSSTAVVMQLLTENGEIASPHGRAVFSVLLFQDLMVVPILILVTIFGSESDRTITNIVVSALIKAVVAITGIILLGRYVFRYLFRIAARAHAVEVFMAATLLIVLFTSAVTGVSGLSMALGAFLAGVLLAETEFRHQIEVDIEPFKGLFLGLFFMGVGMNIDFVLAFEAGYWVLLSVVGLLLLKTLCGLAVAAIFRLPLSTSLRTALLLSEAGEFAFLVIGQASMNFSIIDRPTAQFMVVVAGVSMVLTPALAWLASWAGRRIEDSHESGAPVAELSAHEDHHDHVVIAGFGRVGQAVASVLNTQSIPYVALDSQADQVAYQRREYSVPVFHGDASNTDLLKKAGIASAQAFIITMDQPSAALQAVKVVHQHWPALPIIVRAKDDAHSEALMQAGASQVVPELYESSLQMASHVLRQCHYTREEADACIELVRRHNYEEVIQHHIPNR